MITDIHSLSEVIGLEADYRLEDWMLETHNINAVAVEDELELEPWMKVAASVVEDDEIELENWMFVFHR